jgi:hypothetical protein
MLLVGAALMRRCPVNRGFDSGGARRRRVQSDPPPPRQAHRHPPMHAQERLFLRREFPAYDSFVCESIRIGH